MNLKTSFYALLATGLVVPSAFAAGSGTIQFTGSISSTTCKISGGIPGRDDPNFEVSLGSTNAADFPLPGMYGPMVPYSIYIGGDDDLDCPDGVKVWAVYEVTANVDRITGALNITYGDAEGIQVRLFDKHGTAIDIASNPEPVAETIEDHQATLSYSAAYQRYGGRPLVLGRADTVALYSVRYEK